MKSIWMNGLLMIALAAGFASCDDDDKVDPKDTESKSANVNVGGETQPNQVYVNLETGEQTVVNRGDWDLGFSTDNENVVFLNSSAGMLASSTGKSDFNAVTSADTAGMTARFSLDAIFSALFAPQPPAWLAQTSAWYDSPDGDPEMTAIDAVSSVDAENEVYIINRGKTPAGAERGWQKVKVTLTGTDTYTVEYGDIDETTGQSVTLTKDPDFNLVFLNFDQGEVTVEPPKDDWHVMLTTYTITQNFGFDIPYLINDYVILNRNNTGSYQEDFENTVDITADFEAYTLADIPAAADFNFDIDAIGSSWRTVATPQVPGSVTGVRMDRIYIINDGDGNYFKLLFTGMLSEGGERGFPKIRFALL